MKNFSFKSLKRQAGLTLIEVIAAVAIGAIVIGGALTLYSSGSSAQNSQQLTTDIAAIQSATKTLYAGAGGYGTGSLNSVLINGGKIPGSETVSGTTINHSLNGTITVTGATTNFTIAVTNIPTSVCMNMITNTTSYNSITVGANAALTTFPVAPATASTNCSAAATQTITFQSS